MRGISQDMFVLIVDIIVLVLVIGVIYLFISGVLR